jgi:hypothetical protein
MCLGGGGGGHWISLFKYYFSVVVMLPVFSDSDPGIAKNIRKKLEILCLEGLGTLSTELLADFS